MDPERLQRAISGAQAGRPEAYRALLEAYWPRLYGYFLRATGNHHDAEDLLGDLGLRMVRQLKSYREQGRFDHWLFRIAANMVRDRIRRYLDRSLAEDGVGRIAAVVRGHGREAMVGAAIVGTAAASIVPVALYYHRKRQAVGLPETLS